MLGWLQRFEPLAPEHNLETLKAAAAAGFKDADKIDRDRAFAPLRSDDEFRRLMTELRESP